MQDKDMMQKAGLVWLGFFLVLCLSFIILKLTAIIAWSWLWVLAPIWIPMAISTLCAILGIKQPNN